jgi:membrane protease YdiL (CAAX protease family)
MSTAWKHLAAEPATLKVSGHLMSDLEFSRTDVGLPSVNKPSRVTRFIRNWSEWTEFCIVLGIAFGITFAIDICRLPHPKHYVFRNSLLLTTSGFQAVILGAVLWVGQIRGWSLSSFGTRVSWRGTFGGVLLHVLLLAMGLAAGAFLQKLHPEPQNYSSVPMALPAVLLASIVNPIFEETLESGYIVSRLQRFGPWVAIGASAIVRGIAHLYQGVNGVIDAFIFGAVMALVYWRYRQLWPLVLAHGTLNFMGFIAR